MCNYIHFLKNFQNSNSSFVLDSKPDISRHSYLEYCTLIPRFCSSMVIFFVIISVTAVDTTKLDHSFTVDFSEIRNLVLNISSYQVSIKCSVLHISCNASEVLLIRFDSEDPAFIVLKISIPVLC